MRERIAQLASLILLLVGWTAVADAVGTNILPTPAQVVPYLVDLFRTGEVVDPLIGSIVRTVIGFLFGFAIGVGLGIAAGRSPIFSSTIAGVLMLGLFSPSLIVIFMGVVMLGITDFSVVLVVALLTIPQTTVYIRSVIHAIDEDMLTMADSYQVGIWDKIKGIYVPYLIPAILASGRGGFSHAWKIVVLAEVVGFPNGIGYQIYMNYREYNMPVLLAWLLVFILVVLLIEQALRAGERAVVKWR